jgi:hypothetical protein
VEPHSTPSQCSGSASLRGDAPQCISNVNQLFAKLDQQTHEHRHRLHIKIMEGQTREEAGSILKRRLQSALDLAKAMPTSLSHDEGKVLLRLLTDLQEKIQTCSA